MKQIDPKKIQVDLSQRFEVAILTKDTAEGVEVRLKDIEYGEGFKIVVKPEWRSLTGIFIPDNFSAPLLKTMGSADVVKKDLFLKLAESFVEKYQLEMNLNNSDVDILNPQSWTSQWSNLKIVFIQSPIHIRELDNEELENSIVNITTDILSLILSLIPFEERSIENNIVGLPEGALEKIEVNKYERSQYNRNVCLMIHGSSCKVCDFDFEKFYGEIGKGFIHVHHVTPVSKIGPEYVVNPATDLIPLCPNCHAMVHRRNPPFSIHEIKEIIEEKEINLNKRAKINELK